jgi:hypothetical protein
MEDDYEYAFSTYNFWQLRGGYRFDAPTAGTFLLPVGESAAGGTGLAITAAGAGLAVAYLDPGLATANTRTNYYNISASALVNATAPTVTFTVGLYPVSAVAGAAATLSVTLGTVVAGSTVAFASPALDTLSHATSGDFTAPAAGFYALAVVVSGSAAASSSVAIAARVMNRQV